MSDSLQPHGLQQARPPCPIPSPKVCPSSCPLHWCSTGGGNGKPSQHTCHENLTNCVKRNDHHRRYHFYSHFAVKETVALRGEASGSRVGFELRHVAISHYATSFLLSSFRSGTVLKVCSPPPWKGLHPTPQVWRCTGAEKACYRLCIKSCPLSWGGHLYLRKLHVRSGTHIPGRHTAAVFKK